jgi:uncharacterized protein YajQ (UPF0234 family)
MPTFDVVSELDHQEIRNAVDQAAREVETRFDFKGTDSRIELSGEEIQLHSSTEDRLNALIVVLEEKLVRRKVSLKSLDRGPIVEGSKGSARMTIKLVSGISSEKAKSLSKAIRDLGLKGVVPQIQGDQLRVSGKKRDDLQEVISKLKEGEFGLPLQFTNFRD